MLHTLTKVACTELCTWKKRSLGKNLWIIVFLEWIIIITNLYRYSVSQKHSSHNFVKGFCYNTLIAKFIAYDAVSDMRTSSLPPRSRSTWRPVPTAWCSAPSNVTSSSSTAFSSAICRVTVRIVTSRATSVTRAWSKKMRWSTCSSATSSSFHAPTTARRSRSRANRCAYLRAFSWYSAGTGAPTFMCSINYPYEQVRPPLCVQ